MRIQCYLVDDRLVVILCYCLPLQDKLLSRLDDADCIKLNEANNDENEVEKYARE